MKKTTAMSSFQPFEILQRWAQEKCFKKRSVRNHHNDFFLEGKYAIDVGVGLDFEF